MWCQTCHCGHLLSALGVAEMLYSIMVLGEGKEEKEGKEGKEEKEGKEGKPSHSRHAAFSLHTATPQHSQPTHSQLTAFTQPSHNPYRCALSGHLDDNQSSIRSSKPAQSPSRRTRFFHSQSVKSHHFEENSIHPLPESTLRENEQKEQQNFITEISAMSTGLVHTTM